MGLYHSPRIVTDGLVLCLDAANTKGYDKFENIQLYSNSLDVSATPSGYGGGYGQGWMQNSGDITKSNDGYGTYFTTTYSLVWSAYGTCNTSTSTVYTVSFYAKSSTVANIRPRLYSNVNGTVSTGTYQSLQTGGVPDLGDWRKFTFVMPSTTNTGNSLIIELSTGTGFNIKNIQVERGITATEYYPTTTSIKTRGTTLTDLSLGGGNNGTLVNGVGYSNGALSFDGIDDYVGAGNLGSFYTQGTISYWMYSTAVENYRNPFSTHYLGVNAGIRFEQYTTTSPYGGFSVVIGNDGGSYAGYSYLPSSVLSSNTWYNVVLVWNTTTNNATGYLNGVQKFSSSHTLWATTLPSISIGSGFNSSRYFKGNIATTQIYNKALTALEVQQNFNATRGRFGI